MEKKRRVGMRGVLVVAGAKSCIFFTSYFIISVFQSNKSIRNINNILERVNGECEVIRLGTWLWMNIQRKLLDNLFIKYHLFHLFQVIGSKLKKLNLGKIFDFNYNLGIKIVCLQHHTSNCLWQIISSF